MAGKKATILRRHVDQLRKVSAATILAIQKKTVRNPKAQFGEKPQKVEYIRHTVWAIEHCIKELQPGHNTIEDLAAMFDIPRDEAESLIDELMELGVAPHNSKSEIH